MEINQGEVFDTWTTDQNGNLIPIMISRVGGKLTPLTEKEYWQHRFNQAREEGDHIRASEYLSEIDCIEEIQFESEYGRLFDEAGF